MISRPGPALGRLLDADPTLRGEVEGAIFAFLRKYNPDQPRVPAGQREGGRWTNTGAGPGLFGLQPGIRPLLQHPSFSSPATPDLRTLVHQAFLDERHTEDDTQPLVPMEDIHPLAHPSEIQPLDPMEGLNPSAHPTDVLATSLGLALYHWLSAANSPSSQAVVKFVARGFHRESEAGPFDLASVERLDRDEVRSVCESIDEVQSLTDQAVETVMKNGGGTLPPAQFGTAVHLQLKKRIDDLDDPNFRAEVSLIKTIEAGREANYYGEKGSIRVDVLVRSDPQTACVYDIKSGREGLILPRSKEIADNVFRAFGPVREIIVTEIRPRR